MPRGSEVDEVGGVDTIVAEKGKKGIVLHVNVVRIATKSEIREQGRARRIGANVEDEDASGLNIGSGDIHAAGSGIDEQIVRHAEQRTAVVDFGDVRRKGAQVENLKR